jgi:hypothetical protein
LVTAIIGCSDDEDVVKERIWTTPKPQLLHRAIRPIVPTQRNRLVRLDNLDFRCEDEDGTVKITALPLVERNDYLRVWLVFEPALTRQLVWTAEYRPKGLWTPLREKGFDYLGWSDQLPTFEGRSGLVSIVLKFIFPAGDYRVGVKERRGYGCISEPIRLDSGQWLIEWHDAEPSGRNYQWDVTMLLKNGSARN